MYGTIAKIKTKPENIKVFMDMEMQRRPEGIAGSLVYQSDHDPNEFWLVVVFKDKETYFKNANSPEQHQEYLTFRALMDAEPEWHDGEIVFDDLLRK
jgi:quinol monooxygenase YgiN